MLYLYSLENEYTAPKNRGGGMRNSLTINE